MPMTMKQHEASLRLPALCEQLPLRDLLDGIGVRTNGALVKGYELGGVNSYFHSDDQRNQTKFHLEAVIRSLPERSMRLQMRFEIGEGLDGLLTRYNQCQ